MKSQQIKQYLRQLVTTNRRAKLICLLLAIVVWAVVAYGLRGEDNGEKWGLDDIRLIEP